MKQVLILFRNSLIIIFLVISNCLEAQLSGTITVPGTYSSVAAVVNDLNLFGVNGPLTVNVSSGYTETVPVGGIELNATGSPTAPIVFQKIGIGANPLLLSYTGGTATPSSFVQDGILRLVGSDYITIDGFSFIDVNTANPATMEYGLGFYKLNATNGCSNNTIKKCQITLSINNNLPGNYPSENGSCGILLTNATYSNATTPLTITAISGTSSNNRFYNNLIQNCNIGVSMLGHYDASPYNFSDWNNDFGGTSLSTGNNVINYGGAPSGTVAAIGIKTLNQYNTNVSYNYVNNNTGSVTNHKSALWGVYLGQAYDANMSVNNNTVSVKSDAINSNLCAIENAVGAVLLTNTININNNLITNCSQDYATNAFYHGIKSATQNASVLNVNNNIFLNNSSNSNAGYYSIYLHGNYSNEVNINNNQINGITFYDASVLHSYYGIMLGASATSQVARINNNSFQGINYIKSSPASSGILIYNGANSTNSVSISNNTCNNINVKATGSYYFIYNNGAPLQLTVNSNSIIGSFKKTGSGGRVGGFYSVNSNSSGSVTVSNNDFSNVFVNEFSDFYGIYQSGALSTNKIFNNKITNISGDKGPVICIQAANGSLTSTINNNLVNNIIGANGFYGIRFGTSTNNSGCSVFSNTISSVKINSWYDIFGISYNYGNQVNVYKNKIFNIYRNASSGVKIVGIEAGGNTANSTHNIYNNFIGDLNAPNVSNINASIIGISSNGNTNVTAKIFYNTININASSSGADFGTSGIYHVSSVTSTNNKLFLKNNIIINNSTANGLGKVNAIERQGVALANYDVTSDNNLFYAGVPSPNNLIYYDGTNAYQTISAFKAAVSPREALSFTENTPFITTVGTSSLFLHVNNYTTTVAESGAVNFGGITDDFDADIRQGNTGYSGTGTAPDIGADEFEINSTPCSTITAGVPTSTLEVKCYGQSQTFNPVGFTLGSDITYQWMVANSPGGPYSNVSAGVGGNSPAYSPGFIAPGTYYYIMIAKCSSSSATDTTSEIKFVVNSLPTITISSSNTVCTGSSVILTASGANTYIWSTSAITATTLVTPLATSIYFVKGYDLNGCMSTISKTISTVSLPTLSVSGNNTICYGGTTSLTANGAVSYTWSTGSTSTVVALSPTLNTTYTVSGTDLAGCIGSTTKSIIVNPLPILNITSTNSLLCSGQTATLTASGAISYTWTPGVIIFPSVVINPSVTTTYSVNARDLNGCYNFITYTQYVSLCTGIEPRLGKNESFNIYPNPSSGIFNVYSDSRYKELQIEVYNSIGQLVVKECTVDSHTIISFSDFTSGIYYLKIMHGTELLYFGKIISVSE